MPGSGWPSLAVPWLSWLIRPTSISAAELPVPVILLGLKWSWPDSSFWKSCCFCPRSMVTPNFNPCAPISLVSLSLNCSESLCANTFGMADH